MIKNYLKIAIRNLGKNKVHTFINITGLSVGLACSLLILLWVQNEQSIEWMGHATKAESCMAFLKQQLPDVIFMDINMPGKSGIDLCKEVKEKYSSIFVIGLSTFNQQSLIQNIRRLSGHKADR